jgi:hypothetical protein
MTASSYARFRAQFWLARSEPGAFGTDYQPVLLLMNVVSAVATTAW